MSTKSCFAFHSLSHLIQSVAFISLLQSCFVIRSVNILNLLLRGSGRRFLFKQRPANSNLQIDTSKETNIIRENPLSHFKSY